MDIPEVLKNYLSALGDADAEQVWDYLDSTPEVASEMIEIIADSHKDLFTRLCGDDSIEAKEIIAEQRDQPVNGRLEDWHAYFGGCLFGKIFGDTKDRFKDGTEIRTSAILSPPVPDLKEGDTIITKNSRYLLGKRAG